MVYSAEFIMELVSAVSSRFTQNSRLVLSGRYTDGLYVVPEEVLCSDDILVGNVYEAYNSFEGLYDCKMNFAKAYKSDEVCVGDVIINYEAVQLYLDKYTDISPVVYSALGRVLGSSAIQVPDIVVRKCVRDPKGNLPISVLVNSDEEHTDIIREVIKTLLNDTGVPSDLVDSVTVLQATREECELNSQGSKVTKGRDIMAYGLRDGNESVGYVVPDYTIGKSYVFDGFNEPSGLYVLTDKELHSNILLPYGFRIIDANGNGLSTGIASGNSIKAGMEVECVNNKPLTFKSAKQKWSISVLLDAAKASFK